MTQGAQVKFAPLGSWVSSLCRTVYNRASYTLLVVLSLLALLMVVSGYMQPPQADEDTAAHIFQLAIVMLVPAIVVFLATSDWIQPLRSVRRLFLPVTALILAFGALYYLEHVG